MGVDDELARRNARTQAMNAIPSPVVNNHVSNQVTCSVCTDVLTLNCTEFSSACNVGETCKLQRPPSGNILLSMCQKIDKCTLDEIHDSENETKTQCCYNDDCQFVFIDYVKNHLETTPAKAKAIVTTGTLTTPTTMKLDVVPVTTSNLAAQSH